ncbi:hypothetical protein CHS0354_043180 [Potamilus streckersoni]|uniref:CARD domain-containing protein n=1 Tax=Potamilus streckersoni TaxID=2493646 RepID=A0AAE0VZT1_9BIVA|nr:hypothetical protein CHS0354_043180 [Potamilus streckersoni]
MACRHKQYDGDGFGKVESSDSVDVGNRVVGYIKQKSINKRSATLDVFVSRDSKGIRTVAGHKRSKSEGFSTHSAKSKVTNLIDILSSSSCLDGFDSQETAKSTYINIERPLSVSLPTRSRNAVQERCNCDAKQFHTKSRHSSQDELFTKVSFPADKVRTRSLSGNIDALVMSNDSETTRKIHSFQESNSAFYQIYRPITTFTFRKRANLFYSLTDFSKLNINTNARNSFNNTFATMKSFHHARQKCDESKIPFERAELNSSRKEEFQIPKPEFLSGHCVSDSEATKTTVNEERKESGFISNILWGIKTLFSRTPSETELNSSKASLNSLGVTDSLIDSESLDSISLTSVVSSKASDADSLASFGSSTILFEDDTQIEHDWRLLEKESFHRIVLRRCFPMLLRDLDVAGITDYVYQTELLDDVTFRDMKDLQRTSHKIRLLIESVWQGDQSVYEQFKKCLVLSEQSYLKDILEEEEAKLLKENENGQQSEVLWFLPKRRPIISLRENKFTASIQAYTRTILESSVRKRRFVQTRGYKGAESVLFNETGLSYVLIVGEKGDGRKSIAYELMATAVRYDQTIIPLIFDKMEQWNTSIDVNTDMDVYDLDVPRRNQTTGSNMIIYLRDDFGKHFSIDYNFHSKDLLIQVKECAQQGHLIIMSMTKSLFLQLQHENENELKSDDLQFILNENHIIDLSHSQYTLNDDNKLNILRQHFAETSTEGGQELMLSEYVCAEILIAAPSMGFPKLIEEFTASRNNIEKTSSFFCEPKTWQVRELGRMKQSTCPADMKRYFTLLAVLIHPEGLYKERLVGNFLSIPETNEDINTLKNEKHAFLLNFAQKRSFMDKMVPYITDGVRLLCDTYINEINGKLSFLGKALECAMAISALPENPMELIKIIDLECLCAVLRPSFTKDIPCFPLKTSDRDMCIAVFSRITNIFLSGCLQIISSFRFLEDPDIFEQYLQYLLDKGLLSDVLEAEDQESGNSLIVYGLDIIFMNPCTDGSFNVTEKILRTIAWQQLSQRSFLKVLKYNDRAKEEWLKKQMTVTLTESLHKENKKTYCEILERSKTLSLSTCKEHFESAIESELYEIALVLLKYTEHGNTFPTEFKSEKLHRCLQLLLTTENRGFLGIARALVECGADVNCDPENNYIFHQAVHDKRKDLIKDFVHLGLSPNLRDEDGKTVLSKAIRKGDIDLVQLLLDLGADLKVSDSDGMRPIHVAISVGNVDILKQFLFIDENMVHFTDEKLRSPLHYSRNGEIDDILIQFGTNICTCEECERYNSHTLIYS